MDTALTPLDFVPARLGGVTPMPDGPVDLYMAVVGDDGQIIGIAPITRPPVYVWRDGGFGIDYGEVAVPLHQAGRYRSAYVIAVSPSDNPYRFGQAWRPVFRIDLPPPPGEDRNPALTPHAVVHVRDGWMRIKFDGENDPDLPPPTHPDEPSQPARIPPHHSR